MLVAVAPGGHGRPNSPNPALAIRFHNVAGTGSRGERSRIQLCGRLSVELDGVELVQSLRGKQVPLLLAYLVLNRDRPVGRDELIGALWPETAPRSQDAALRTLLSRLRSALGRDVVFGRDELGLVLPEPAWVDVEAAASEVWRAQRALESGDARAAWALAQVPLNIASRGLLPGTQAAWLEPRRQELADIRLQALEVIGRAGLSLGGTQLGSVERAARTLIDSEPYRESGYVLLMAALEAQGNVAEGLRVFEQLRALLRDELGVAPSPEAIQAHERLLNSAGRRAERMGVHRAVRGMAPPAEIEVPAELRRAARRRDRSWVARPSLRSWPRRWKARRTITRALPSTSGAGLMLLAGEPGIGKTRRSLAETGGARALPSGRDRCRWRGVPRRRRSCPTSPSWRPWATTSRGRRWRSCGPSPGSTGRRSAGSSPSCAAACPSCPNLTPVTPRPIATGCSRRWRACWPRSPPPSRCWS